MQARALGPLKAQTKPGKYDVQSQQKNFEDSEDNDEEKVQIVDQERRRSTEFVGDANVEPVGQLNLDDARKAKIPHFLSAWFNTGEKKTAKDPNASIALVPALALDETSSPMDIAMLQSNPELFSATARGYSRNINYSDITLGRIIGEGAFAKVDEGN